MTDFILACPDCGRRGVYKRIGRVGDYGDVYKCRYEYLGCDFEKTIRNPLYDQIDTVNGPAHNASTFQYVSG